MTFLTEDDRKLAEYLGDGAYIRRGAYLGEVIIFASDGISRTNTVHLDPQMIENLEAWLKVNKNWRPDENAQRDN